MEGGEGMVSNNGRGEQAEPDQPTHLRSVRGGYTPVSNAKFRSPSTPPWDVETDMSSGCPLGVL